MSTPKERVMAERQRVYEDFQKLHGFLKTPINATIVGEGHWTLMQEQHDIMADYIRVLDGRISLFNKTKS